MLIVFFDVHTQVKYELELLKRDRINAANGVSKPEKSKFVKLPAIAQQTGKPRSIECVVSVWVLEKLTLACFSAL